MSRFQRVHARSPIVGALSTLGVTGTLLAQAGAPGPCCCPGDLDADGIVNESDAHLLQLIFGECPAGADCPGDFNEDGTIDGMDLARLLTLFGPCTPGDFDQDGWIGEPDALFFEACLFAVPCPPDPCSPFDVDKDGLVGESDANIVAASFGECGACLCPYDFNDDGRVDTNDVLELLANAGFACPGDLDRDRVFTDVDVELLTDMFGECDPDQLCPGDLNGDGEVNDIDLGILLEKVGTACCTGDVNRDGKANARDVTVVIASQGECPPDEPCPADVNGDGIVNARDIGIVTGSLDACCVGDLDRDREVDFDDLLQLLADAGPGCPDTNLDGEVTFFELLGVLKDWTGGYDCPPFLESDFNADCRVDFADLLHVLNSWGSCCD